MLAVRNTSPISNLAFIGRLDLLKLQFGTFWIPTAVVGELAVHPNPVALAAIHKATLDQWIKTAAALDAVDCFLSSVNQGEAEAIALAAELKANIVIIDEQESDCESGWSLLTGALGVLLRATLAGHIYSVKPEIQALRHKAGFYISPSLEAAVLASAGE